MQTSICSRCGKNPAVVFITKIEAGQTKTEGLCLKCARELHIKPIDDIMNRMGVSDEDLDNLSEEMMSALNGAEDLLGIEGGEGSEDDEDGKLKEQLSDCLVIEIFNVSWDDVAGLENVNKP